MLTRAQVADAEAEPFTAAELAAGQLVLIMERGKDAVLREDFEDAERQAKAINTGLEVWRAAR